MYFLNLRKFFRRWTCNSVRICLPLQSCEAYTALTHLLQLRLPPLKYSLVIERPQLVQMNKGRGR
jgi:hypothetical protein